MRSRLSRISRILRLQATLEKTDRAQLAALQRQREELDRRTRQLLEFAANCSFANELVLSARRRLGSLASECKTLDDDILLARTRLVSTRRKGEGARRLAAKLTRAIADREERALLEEIALAPPAKASRKAGDR